MIYADKTCRAAATRGGGAKLSLGLPGLSLAFSPRAISATVDSFASIRMSCLEQKALRFHGGDPFSPVFYPLPAIIPEHNTPVRTFEQFA